MHTIEIPETGFKKYIPGDLSECDSRQYSLISELLFYYHTQQITEEEFFNDAVFCLMNMKHKETKGDEKSEKYFNIILIADLIKSSFFSKETTPEGKDYLHLIQNYIHNPIPTFSIWRNYYGPSDGFMNVKIGEYTDALKTFLQFRATGDINLLYELAAILYRPKKTFHFITKHFSNYDGDCRVKYNYNHLEKRIKFLKYAPIGFIYGVYLYFAAMQIYISSAPIPWGDKVLDLSILFNGDVSSPQIDQPDLGLDSVIFAMAESSAFGDFEKVQQTSFWTMMIKMYDSRINQLKEQKQQEDANNQQT